jgi:hypothetical protein
MTKPLAGKRFFESMGRSASSRGLSILANRLDRQNWPGWARSAYSRGWVVQYYPAGKISAMEAK